MGTLIIDDRKYARVLAKVLPRVIATDKEHERMLNEVEKLIDKGEHRTAEEDAALDLMVHLIKEYENEHHPLRDPSPQEMLVYLMEQRNLKQASPDVQIAGICLRCRQREARHQQGSRKSAGRVFQGLSGRVHLDLRTSPLSAALESV